MLSEFESEFESESESGSESESKKQQKRVPRRPSIRGPVQPIGEFQETGVSSNQDSKSKSKAVAKKLAEAQTSTEKPKARVVNTKLPKKLLQKPEPRVAIVRRKRAVAPQPDQSDSEIESDKKVESKADADETEELEPATTLVDIQSTEQAPNSPLLVSSPPERTQLDSKVAMDAPVPEARRRKTKSLPFKESVIFSATAPSTPLEFDKFDKNALRDHYLDWAVQNGFAVHIRKSNDKPLLGAIFVRLTCKENRAQREKSKRNPYTKPCPWSLRLNKKLDPETGKDYWMPHQVCSDHNHDQLENPTELVAYRKLFKRTYSKCIQDSIKSGKSYDQIISDLQKLESLKRIKAEDIPISKKDVLNAKASLKTGRSLIFPVDG